MTDESIFAAALAIGSPADRAAFLDRACADNRALRQELAGLLAAHAADNPLDRPPADLARTGAYEPSADAGPAAVGERIGPYRLMEQIGEGGFGLVFVAEQSEPVRRKVALKVLKPGMDTRDVVARFEAERQALALMDHPNIARVFDAGSTAQGRPYFVMELVRGVPITDFCDGQKLPPRERLNLFVQVCQAVQHAHQKGVIHRDLKPSNVLVTVVDGAPVPKVIDFGVAKAVGQSLTDKTIYTRFAQMIGTPLYMSPEQAQMSGVDVDTRADVYALGVLLYELLTGTTPFDRDRFKKAAFDEICRIIKEEEPPKPSTRLSSLGITLPTVSAHRGTDPGRLPGLVRGELDWIVMKALEKDRNRRYDTATGLAKDVQRYLADEAVEARPPSAAYRFRKMAHRNRAALTTAAVVAVALLAGTAVSAWQALRATQAEAAACRNEAAAHAQQAAADAAKDQAEQRSQELRDLNYVADMNLARHAWDESNLALMRDLLDRHKPRSGEADRRGFEWHYLNGLTHHDLFTLKAHTSSIFTVAWTPDGNRLITLGLANSAKDVQDPDDYFTRATGEIKLWDATTRQLIPGSFQMPSGTMFRAALSPDGKLLATGAHDKRVRIWNIDTRKLVATLEGHSVELVSNLAWHPDGKHLASLGASRQAMSDPTHPDTEVRIWDVETRSVVARIDGLPFSTQRLAFSRDGKYLAAGASGNTLKVWDAATGVEAFHKDMEGMVNDVTFSPDGRRLAVSGFDMGIRILAFPSLELLRTLQEPGEELMVASFSPDGKQLAALGNLAGLVELFDVQTGQLTRTIRGHAEPIFDVAFSPDGTRLATSDYGGLVKVWELADDRDVVSIPGEGLLSKDIWLSPDGRIAVTGRGIDTLHLFDAATGAPSGPPVKLEHTVVALVFSADGKRLTIVDAGPSVSVWDIAASKRLRSFPVDGPKLTVTMAVSPDGKWLVRAGSEGSATVWSVETGAEVHRFDGLRWVADVGFSPDGRRVAAAGGGRLRVWNSATGRELLSAELKEFDGSRLQFSPDSKRLAVASYQERETRILDAESGRQVSPPLKGTLNTCWCFSPDGQRLIGGTPNGTIKSWDLATGQEVLTLKGHKQTISAITFTPDGRRLISTSHDMTVRVWDATPRPDEP